MCTPLTSSTYMTFGALCETVSFMFNRLRTSALKVKLVPLWLLVWPNVNLETPFRLPILVAELFLIWTTHHHTKTRTRYHLCLRVQVLPHLRSFTSAVVSRPNVKNIIRQVSSSETIRHLLSCLIAFIQDILRSSRQKGVYIKSVRSHHNSQLSEDSYLFH